jgi:hypothetical protein
MFAETVIRIRTNNIPRDVINAWELTPAERAEFDYLDWAAIDDGRDSADFFRYRGQLYDLGEFSRIIPPGSELRHPMECAESAFQGWDGYLSDSYFSSLLVRWARDENGRIDSERVVVGLYTS